VLHNYTSAAAVDIKRSQLAAAAVVQFGTAKKAERARVETVYIGNRCDYAIDYGKRGSSQISIVVLPPVC
jgi:hypothetical protein